MSEIPFTQTETFSLFVLPVLIFLARMTDVSIATVRTIYVYRGRKLAAFVLGFIEILIWIMAINAALKNLSHWFNAVAYAGGFATGNYFGIVLEEKLAFGRLLIRIFTGAETAQLESFIHASGYTVTRVLAKGKEGPLQILYLIINRQDYPAITRKINALHPKAFYTVEDIRTAREGVFPSSRPAGFLTWMRRRGK